MHSDMSLRTLGAAIMVATLAALALLGSSCQDDEDTSTIVLGGSGVEINGEAWDYRGSAMSREIEMPDAVLTSTHGADFDVRSETEGFVTLLYVGYTHCPDLCPTHMAAVARALNGLPADAAARVRVLFVTSDPDRDSPSVLGAWLAQFDPSFIGLTGSDEELVAFQRDLGMNPATTEPGNHEHQDYSVNHAGYILAFPSDSRTALIAYPPGAASADYLADLATLTAGGP
jgi:protein SCO1